MFVSAFHCAASEMFHRNKVPNIHRRNGRIIKTSCSVSQSSTQHREI